MLNPMSIELLHREMVRRRLAEARQDALAAQLPASSRLPGPAALIRLYLASALRALAMRLDPSLAQSPRFVAASSR